ncbi:polyprenyl synthetase family protein [Pseudonocardiaceae bacterium YIM PH 21723]|nr:polyprenyl synthetase family protein [Pseudonocardiaceae bacterium YIM PH 21723]
MSATDERSAPPVRPAKEVLSAARQMIDPALRAAVDTLPTSMRRIAGYHFGWWDEREQPVSVDPGKALRPALSLLAAEVVGGTQEVAVPVAVATELVHNFSLLHDDVMDGDVTRRHRATAWTVFGRGAAILAGDSLLTLAFDVVGATGHPAANEVMRAIGGAVQDLVHGQSCDLDFQARTDVGLTECLKMAAGKTGALLGASCAIGGLFGGGGSDQVLHLREFGERIGIAFQLTDDLLGIWGDPEVTGKPVHSDLANRKKSLPVVAALGAASPAAQRLAEVYLRDEPLRAEELAEVAQLIEEAGGRAWAQRHATELLETALGHLHAAAATVDSRAVAELRVLADLASRRAY